VIGYRWLALSIAGEPRLFLHTHGGLVETAEREARDALGVQAPPERRQKKTDTLHMLADDRAVESEWSAAPIVENVHFGRSPVATVALGPGRRGASVDDRSFMSLLARELGGPVQMVALVAEARRLANTDSLTGLLNRRAFVEAVTSGRARMTPLSMLLLDIDHFKKVNDTRGHDAGDAVLRGVAQVLGAMGRRSDLVARWGGEEFVIALAQTAEAGARVAAERVRRAIAETEYELPNGDRMNATASIGLVTETGDAWELDDVLSRADKAMYAAKSRGRNRVEVL
jgi:diguanylate cyclase (GGDEF)-like protein